MAQQLKVISLNIEGDKHYDWVIPFLRSEQPDVVCLQEVFESDVSYLSENLIMHPFYAPTAKIVTRMGNGLSPKGLFGCLILSKAHPLMVWKDYYVGSIDDIPILVDKEPYYMNRVLLGMRVPNDREDISIATTHFTWSSNGQASDEQRIDPENLFALLQKHSPLVLAGDFNAPRGREIFGKLAERYRDNIPINETTSLDSNLHYAKDSITYVVDGLFSSPEYVVEEVRLIGGVSDHKAIVGMVSKTSSG